MIFMRTLISYLHDFLDYSVQRAYFPEFFNILLDLLDSKIKVFFCRESTYGHPESAISKFMRNTNRCQNMAWL